MSEQTHQQPRPAPGAGQTTIRSMGFTAAQGQEMAELTATGHVKLDVFEHQTYALEDLNQVLIDVQARQDGFSNFVVAPQAPPRRAGATRDLNP